MALDPSYLEYPRRAHGMDHDLYRWSSLFDRPKVDWGEGRRVAIVPFISLEWFPITPSDTPFRAPGHMQTAYPDYRHYTSREYGTRVGFYRLLDAFAKVGVTATVAVNGAIAERYPAIVRDIAAAGHEIVAHSTDMNGTIASGLPEDQERTLINSAFDTLERVTGTRPLGWHSIARSQSWNTPRLLVEAGARYMCDWVNDELPYAFRTDAGPIVSVPIDHELSDRQIITVQQQSVDSYAQQIEDAYAWLDGEVDAYGGRMLAMHLTPYVIGLPYRIAAFEQLLARLVAKPGAWFAKTGEVAAIIP